VTLAAIRYPRYGLDGDGGFAYLNTHERLGVILELIEVPARRREPEETR
jgi:methylmalonyl-CoA/ethylmalonyl-CoA epimerase